MRPKTSEAMFDHHARRTIKKLADKFYYDYDDLHCLLAMCWRLGRRQEYAMRDKFIPLNRKEIKVY